MFRKLFDYLLRFFFLYYESKRIRYLTELHGFEPKRIPYGKYSIFLLEKKGEPEYPDLVFVHGLLDAGYGFRKLIHHLRYPGRIIIPDLPGFGRSRLPEFSYLFQMDVMAEILYTSLEVLKPNRCILIGHSMGGLISQMMVLRESQRKAKDKMFHKLILLGSGGIPHPRRDEMKRILFPENTDDIGFLLQYLYFADFPKPNWITRRILLSVWDSFSNHSLAENTIRREKEIFFGERASEIDLPTLIIGGRHDELTTPEMMETFHRCIRRSKLVILEKTKHALHIEKPELVANLILDFIKRDIKKPIRNLS
jgi:pimeloyl-ACP methyl ester carboxylesterase